MGETVLTAAGEVFLDPAIWGIVIASAFYGIFIGAMPGLTATMGVALFVPITFWLDPTESLSAIVTMVACAIFAGDIPTTLIRMPGTPASAAYADDAYALARRGDAGRALGIMLWFSVTGGLFGAVVLMLLGGQLAKLANWFSVAEYFWLYLMGLSCAVIVGGASIPRSLLGLLIGLAFSTVGLSAVHGQARFTLGQPELFQGISFIPAMIGLFGLSEVLRGAAALRASAHRSRPGDGPEMGAGDGVIAIRRGPILRPAMQLFASRLGPWVRSGSIGALVGILPGAGADIASWVAAAVSRRRGRADGANGDGSIGSDESTHCIADACTANSASLAGAWIPALVFGIPGDSITAIVIGVLYMKNLKPGPEIFETQGVLVFSLYFVFVLANLVMLPIGLLAISAGGWVMRIPRNVLLSIIVLLCIVGSFAVSGTLFDVAVMAVFGMIGLACERYRISIGAMVLGMILGGPLEERFVQALSGSDGSPIGLVNRPVAAGLAILCAAVWVRVAMSSRRKWVGVPFSDPS
jgi:putative tricarboxylic transport membrane protein